MLLVFQAGIKSLESNTQRPGMRDEGEEKYTPSRKPIRRDRYDAMEQIMEELENERFKPCQEKQ